MRPLYNGRFDRYVAGIIATVTMGSFAWALGKAAPKVVIAVTGAVVALYLLWIPLIVSFVLMGLAGYVIEDNSYIYVFGDEAQWAFA